MPRSPRADAACLALLAAAVLLSGGGPFAQAGLGFVLDDWSLLADLAAGGEAGGLLGQLKTHAARPLSAFAWTLPHAAFGAHAPSWHWLTLALHAALAGAVFFLLRGFSLGRAEALLGGLVFAAFPNKDAALYWPAASILNTSALLLWTAAWLSHARHARLGGEAWRWASAVLLFAALCAYEQAFFLLPLWLLAPEADRARLRRGAWTAAAALAAFAVLKFLVLPALAPSPKSLRLSPAHGPFVYYMALRATLDPRWWWYLARCAADGAVRAPLLAAAAAALPLAALALRRREPAVLPAARSGLLLWGAGLWVLAYLPLCASDYAPVAYDEMNRLNQLPALGLAAMLAAWASASAGRRAALAGLVSFCLAAHASFAGIWTAAQERRLSVRERVLAVLKDWPRDKGLLVRLPQTRVARKAPVFISKHDLSGAIRLWTGEAGREAWAYTPKVSFEEDAAVLFGERRPYESLLLLDLETGRFGPLTRAAARALPPPLEPWERPLSFR